MEMQSWAQKEVFEKKIRRYRTDGKRTPNDLCREMFIRSIEPIKLLAEIGCSRRSVYNFLNAFHQLDYSYQAFCKQLKRFGVSVLFERGCYDLSAKQRKISGSYMTLFRAIVENLPEGTTWPYFVPKEISEMRSKRELSPSS
ncbi:hypothetical protein FAI41_07765 [Acetobacteraceae bacterium]|nr:hypothetical protein FAI41_07765 [Acetobacteraceae bacterium]